MTIWADYSAGRPGGAALKAAGFSGVLRYVGTPGRTKNITSAEYADLIAHGLQVLLVYEDTTSDALGGYSAGVAHAQAAATDAHNCGIPTSVGIAASSDMHLTAAQVTVALEYVRGFRDTLGKPQAGVYGFSELVDPAQAAGYVGWTWKCGTAPSAAEQAWLTFWQRNSGTTETSVNGISCDINDQFNPIPGGDMTNPFSTYSAPAPILDANGTYTGQDAPTPTDFADDERFTNASVRWLIEHWVPSINQAVASMQTALSAMQASQAGKVAAGPYYLTTTSPSAGASTPSS